MKSIFKFAAMALAAVAMLAACNKDDKKADSAELTLNGKVLKVTSSLMGMDVYLDFGKFAENRITMGIDLSEMGVEGIGAMNDLGSFVINPTNATSGVITRTVDNGDGTTSTQNVAYSALTETSCTIDLIVIASPEGAVNGEFVDVTLFDPFAADEDEEEDYE